MSSILTGERLTNRRLVIIAAMAGTFLSALDSSIVGPAMPTIIGQLGGLSLYSWVFSAYLLTSTTTVPLYGRLSDMYGRKPLFVVSAALFVLGSALCGIAQSMEQLVAFRAIQGLGAGGIVPVTFTILGDLFSVEERAKMPGLFSAVWGASAVAGPTLGGLIVQVIDWRWIFYLNLPFGIVSVTLMWRSLHETRTGERSRIDYLGAILLTAGITAFLFALLEIGEGASWLGPRTGGMIVLSALLVAAFIYHENHFPSPMMPMGMFRSPIMAVVTSAGTLIGGVMFGISSFVPLYIQGVLGGTPIDAGLTIAPFSIGWSAASVVSGQIITRAGYRLSVVAGTLSAVAGSVSLLLVSPDTGRWPAAVGSGLVGIGMGLSSTAMLIAVQNSVGWGQRGVATALVQFSRTIGGAIGVAVLGTLLTAQLTSRLSGMDGSMQGANALLDAKVRASLTPDILHPLTTALSSSLHIVFMTMLGLAVVAAVITVLFFPRGSVEELQGADGGMGADRASKADDAEATMPSGAQTRPTSR